MGCCGCSLFASTTTAAALGLVESIVGMAWNILAIVIIESHKNVTADALENHEDASETTVHPDYAEASQFPAHDVSAWDRLKITLSSKESLDKDHIFEIVVTALILNCFWFIASLTLTVGNAEKCKDMLKPWIVSTIVIVVADIAATVYFVVKAVRAIEDLRGMSIESIFVDNLYILCAVLFSRGGIITWVTNIALVIFVHQRIKELEYLRKKKLPFDSDIRITPYPLQSPYEAFEADSSPPGNDTFKPHIPPPDYEGPMGNGRSKRPTSFPLDYDTLQVSSASMGSSRSSTAKRPLSNIYDSRMDTHRNSMTAENVINHAYENRGFDLQSEAWTGIPRPTFKLR